MGKDPEQGPDAVDDPAGGERNPPQDVHADADRGLLVARLREALADAEQQRAVLQRARARSASLLAVVNALSEALTPSDVAQAVVERLHDEVGATSTVFYLASDDLAPARLLAYRGISAETAAKRSPMPLDTPLPLADAIRSLEPVWLHTREEMVARYPLFDASPVPVTELQAVAALPLRIGARRLGGIAIGFSNPRAFDRSKQEFLLSVTSECSLALERASLFQQNTLERERLRVALDAGHMGAWEWDIVSGRVHWSTTLEAIHGLAPGTFPGTFEGWRADMHPDDVERVLAATRRSVEAVERHAITYRIVRPDGEVRWLEAHGHVLTDEAGVARKVIGVCSDVTERRRSAESLQFLAQASEALGASLDTEATLKTVVELAVPWMADWARIEVVEDGALRMVALTHVDPAKLELVRELRARFPPSLDDPRGVGRVIATGKPEVIPEITDAVLVAAIPDPELLRIVRELGFASAMTLPLTVRGRTIGALSLASAESRRRLDESDVAVATEVARRASIAIDHAGAFREANEANRLKDEFLGTVSHELRTPLNAILGWVTLLRGKKAGDPAALAKGLAIIERNARSQSHLIEDVLDVARIISGKLLIQRRPVDGGAVLRAALEIVAPMAAAKGVVLESDIEPDVSFVGDADRLQQVAWNLLSNAVKFTPSGGRVDARLAREGATVELSVSDTGLGMSPELLPFVFDRFRQADSSPSRRHGGLGLGLAIARHLVELHGGTIAVTSPGEGEGSTFTVRLPVPAVRTADERGPQAEAAAVEEEVEPPVALAGLRVLVCDDDADARELLQVVLSSAGAEVMPVSSVAAAMDALDVFRPEVVVSDIAMPDEDGYAFVRRLRARAPDACGTIPAIALTAYARSSDAARALAEGFQVHLAKPIREEELLEAVARVSGRARDRRS